MEQTNEQNNQVKHDNTERELSQKESTKSDRKDCCWQYALKGYSGSGSPTTIDKLLSPFSGILLLLFRQKQGCVSREATLF
jgi:hypothetical protein